MQDGPTSLDLCESFGVPLLGLNGIAGLQAALLFALADRHTQVFRDTFTEPVDTAVGMFQGRGIAKRHCSRLLHQAVGARPLILLILF